jgi:chaperone modulatory protein CbpM
MITIEMVVEQTSVERGRIEVWIERQWVRPARHGDEWAFDVADLARVRLIHELIQDLSIDEGAMPVVLSLLDQVYALRGVLKEIGHVIEELPEPTRSTLRAHLASVDAKTEPHG